MTASVSTDFDRTASRGSEVVLALRNVVKEYPSTPPVRALGGVTIEVRQGEFVTVVGPSGSGKTTLLHIMGTLDLPSSGEVTVAGHDVSGLSDRRLSALRSRYIGFVFQHFHLLGGYTALDNVADGMLYTGTALRMRRERAAEALYQVGLESRTHHVATKLSGGERQRVAIARALVGKPAIVLADEPTGNLDSKTSDSIVALLEELNSSGSTIVVITHNREIAQHFPRVVGLRDGLIDDDRRNRKH